MQIIKKHNLCVSIRTYQDEQGKDKNVYKTIGEITTLDDGKGGQFQLAELYTMPGQTIKVFEQNNNSQQNNGYQR
jgi:hypothetical protein